MRDLGCICRRNGTATFDNPASKKFVADFMAKYHRLPTFYASQSYDAGLGDRCGAERIARQRDGTPKRSAPPCCRRRLPRFAAAFKFGANQHPIQDWWSLSVERGGDGKLFLKTQQKILENRGDAYVAMCKL